MVSAKCDGLKRRVLLCFEVDLNMGCKLDLSERRKKDNGHGKFSRSEQERIVGEVGHKVGELNVGSHGTVG